MGQLPPEQVVLAIRIVNNFAVEERLERIHALSSTADPFADEDRFLPMYTIGFYYRGEHSVLLIACAHDGRSVPGLRRGH